MKTRLEYKFMICRLYLNAMLLRHADEAQQNRNSCPWLLIDRLKWLCPCVICFPYRVGVSVCHLALIVALFEYLSSKLSENVAYNVCDIFTKSKGDNHCSRDLILETRLHQEFLISLGIVSPFHYDLKILSESIQDLYLKMYFK